MENREAVMSGSGAGRMKRLREQLNFAMAISEMSRVPKVLMGMIGTLPGRLGQAASLLLGAEEHTSPTSRAPQR
eukprot:3604329-Amphidinium_carterae.1